MNNIRLYFQIVINQMTYNGNDIYEDHYNTETYRKILMIGYPRHLLQVLLFLTILGRIRFNKYSENIPIFEYPPYCGKDFHCKIQYNNINNLGESWIANSLLDLNTNKPYVQQRIADFLTELISIGIPGFSIYNGIYVSTNDYCQIFERFKNNLGDENLPNDLIIILEMEYNNPREQYDIFCNNDIDSNFGLKFTQKLKNIFYDEDYKKIKLQFNDTDSKINSICEKDWIENERLIIITESQNNQLNDIYNINKNINELLKDSETHKNNYINKFLNDYINTTIKIVFSSYSLSNKGTGFPDCYSDCSKLAKCRKSVPYTKAYDPLSVGYDIGKEGNYTRIHRDIDIVNSMRISMNLEKLTEEELLGVERVKVFGYPTTITTTLLSTIPTTRITTIQTIQIKTMPNTKQLTNIPTTYIINMQTTELIKKTTIGIITNNTTEVNISINLFNYETENKVNLSDNLINSVQKDIVFEKYSLEDYLKKICKINQNKSK